MRSSVFLRGRLPNEYRLNQTNEEGPAPSGWPFFASALDNAQLSLGTADFLTARRYASLAAERVRRVFDVIQDEYERSVGCVLQVARQT